MSRETLGRGAERIAGHWRARIAGLRRGAEQAEEEKEAGLLLGYWARRKREDAG